MKFCYHCGAALTDDITYCPNCGNKQPQITTQTDLQATEQSFYPTQPTVAAPVSKAGLVLGKIGLLLGIASLACGLFFNLMFLLLAVVKPNLGDFTSFNYEPFTLTLGIASVILSGIARKRGNYEKQSLLGLIFGIIGIVLGVLSIIMFFVFAGTLVGSSSDFVI